MAAKLRRLASGTHASLTAATIFTASTRTAVRVIDVYCNLGGQRVAIGVGTADATNVDTAGHFMFFDDVGDTFQWRGSVVLEPGETLVLDSNDVSSLVYMVNGAIDLSLS